MQKKSYYRLKIVDSDGGVEFSGIKKINGPNNERDKSSWTLYPYPASDHVFLQPHMEMVHKQAQLTSLDGCISVTVSIVNSQIYLANYPSGMYVLHLDTENERVAVPLVKR